VKIQETIIKIQEALEDLQVGGILFPKYRGRLFEDEDLKTTENQRLGPEKRQNVPRAWKFTFHAPRAFLISLGHAKNCTMRPVHAKSRGAIVFSCFWNG